MDRVRIKHRYWLIVLLSVLLPGMGHLMIRRWDKAIFTLSSFLFHSVLAYTLLHMVVIEQPLTIAYVMIAIPYHYFYAIFNSLQSISASIYYVSKLKLILSLCLICVSILLIMPQDIIYPIKHVVVDWYPYVILLALCIYKVMNLRKRRNGKTYLARISTTILLALLFILLLLYQIAPIQWDKWLVVIPIVFLVEGIILFFVRYYYPARSGYSLDLWGICVAVVFIGSSYIVVQYSEYPSQLLESFHAPAIDNEQLDAELGFRYELAPIKVSADQLSAMELRHLNGFVKVKVGDVQEVTIYPILYVQTDDEDQAIELRNQSKVDVSFNQGIHVTTSLPRYNLNRYPRMNITIVIPKEHRFVKQLNMRVEHGALSISDVVVSEQLKAESNTAAISLRSTTGKVKIESKRGSIYLRDIAGNIHAESKKGDITILQSSRAIIATSLNGDIYVKAKHVNGDMKLTATVGNIQLYLPEQADYKLEAKVSFGKVTIDPKDDIAYKEVSLSKGLAFQQLELYASDHILIQQ